MFLVPSPEARDGFEFSLDGDTVHTIPLVEDLPLERIEAMNAMRGMSPVDMSLRDLTTTLFGPEIGPVVYGLSAKQFAALVEAWEGASSATVGESDPSGS